MQSTRFDPDVGVTGSEETPAPHAPRTAFKSVRAGSCEYAIASGMLVDASLKGARVLGCCRRQHQAVDAASSITLA